jgi:hypothetical protein
MKNKKTLSIIIIILSAFFFSCEDTVLPEGDNSYNYNYYIFDKITANNVKMIGDSIWYQDTIFVRIDSSLKIIKNKDSVDYVNHRIEICYNKILVREKINQIYYGPSKFLNKINKMDIIVNTDYNNNYSAGDNINNIIIIEDGQTLEEYNNSNENKMTYKLKLIESPNNIQLCSFTILIEDSEDNRFEATTENVYIKP